MRDSRAGNVPHRVWDAGQERNDLCPNGALMWSDGWEAPPSDREILLRAPTPNPGEHGLIQRKIRGHIERSVVYELDVMSQPPRLERRQVLLNADVLERDFK